MTNSPTNSADFYDQSFTEMASISDLKSVPSGSAINTAFNSPMQSSNSESESEIISPSPPHKQPIWPKYKRFRDPITGEEAIYELVDPKNPQKSSKGLFTLYSNLVTISSISLFVASNLFAFTVGMLVGKRIAYDY